MKKIIFLLITILFVLLFFTECTIIFNRWAIDWDDDDSVHEGTLTIDNQTGEVIDSIKFYVNDFPPTDWYNVNEEGSTINSNRSETFSMSELGAINGDVVWIRVAADEWYASKLFAIDGFSFGSTEDDTWIATIYKE